MGAGRNNDNDAQCTIVMLNSNLVNEKDKGDYKKNNDDKYKTGASSVIQKIAGNKQPVKLGEEVSIDINVSSGTSVRTTVMNNFMEMKSAHDDVTAIDDYARNDRQINAFVITVDLMQEEWEIRTLLNASLPMINEHYPDAQISIVFATNNRPLDQPITQDYIKSLIKVPARSRCEYYEEADITDAFRKIVTRKLEVDRKNNNELLVTINACLINAKQTETTKKMKDICRKNLSVEEKLAEISRQAIAKENKSSGMRMFSKNDNENLILYNIFKSDKNPVIKNNELKAFLKLQEKRIPPSPQNRGK